MAKKAHRQYDSIPYWQEIAEVISGYNGEKPPRRQRNCGKDEMFDVAEACACISHDWGEYNLLTYLESVLKFRARPNLDTDNLEELGALIYNRLNDIYGEDAYGKAEWAKMKAEGAEETKGAPIKEE